MNENFEFKLISNPDVQIWQLYSFSSEKNKINLVSIYPWMGFSSKLCWMIYSVYIICVSGRNWIEFLFPRNFQFKKMDLFNINIAFKALSSEPT